MTSVVPPLDQRIQDAVEGLPASLKARSGAVFYSGRAAFLKPSAIYILGLNPGGSVASQPQNTIGRHFTNWLTAEERYSEYLDGEWADGRPGEHGMQPRVRHFAEQLDIDLRETPASNLVFARSADEAQLGAEASSLMELCWPVHEAVIDTLQPKLIICFGKTAGTWVRKKLRATKPVSDWSETYPNRSWKSRAHRGDGLCYVATLTHPSRADWTCEHADPSSFIKSVLGTRG